MMPKWTPYWLRVMWEDHKAKRRGEVRVATGLRGRVYMKKEDAEREKLKTGGAAHDVKAQAMVSLTARKWDHAQQKWIDLGLLKRGPIEEFRKNG